MKSSLEIEDLPEIRNWLAEMAVNRKLDVSSRPKPPAAAW